VVARLRIMVPAFVVLIILIVLLAIFTRTYTDLLFFRSVGFGTVFSTVLTTRIVLFVVFGVVMATAVGANLVVAYLLRPPVRPLSLEQQNLERYRSAVEPYLRLVLIGISAVVGIVAGLSAAGHWRTWMLWLHRTSFGQSDPQFHRDISYYTFVYPFERYLLSFALTIVVVSLVVAIFTHYLFGGIRIQTRLERVVPAAKAHISVLLGLLALLKAAAYYLDRFGTVFSHRGAVDTGASYTDIHAVLPAKLILLFISLLCAVLFIYNIFQRGWTLPVLSAGILLLSSLVIGGIYPALVRQLEVKPNESTREAPYIQRNINATRAAYGLDGIKLQQYEATTNPDAKQLTSDAPTVSSVRLLDPNKLSSTYDQLQQFRGYYGFAPNLDIDRYALPGPGGKTETQDYVTAVRELDQSQLPAVQRNWINLHLTYTHGKGFVAAPANTVDSLGRPLFTEGNLPQTGPLNLSEDDVYFGEMSPNYSIVGTKQAEIDGPGAGPNTEATSSYSGTGGVSIGSTFRQALFALRFGEKNILLSADITDRSRILYLRNPRDRVAKVAPWLTLDGDPYPAVVNGRIVWILDGYTTSDGYPYSARKTLSSMTADSLTAAPNATNRTAEPGDQINYMRNSVKATVDAYNGTVTLYAWDESDPVLKTWEKAFRGTVKPKADISPELMQHLRYPEDFFKVQRGMLASYHVTDPKSFYSQEDFWAVSPSPDNSAQSQPPFYVYSQLVGHRTSTFNLASPLISRGSSKLAAYMAVSSDPGSYGQFQVLRLTGGVPINGPVQAQAAIESNAEVNKDLNILRGGGGQTVTANLLTLPVAGGLLYVEPYYGLARDGYPTLQRVAAVFGDSIGYGPSLADAIKQVFGSSAGASTSTGGLTGTTSGTAPPAAGTVPGGTTPAQTQAAKDAQSAYAAAARALAQNPPDWVAYGQAQKDLGSALSRLNPAPAPAASASAPPPAEQPSTPPSGRPSAAPGASASSAPP
jgi:uncharacterized membrane protein (UPF0182 family)